MNRSFSETNDRLQLAWDASSLKSVQFCPRYYELNNLEGWQPPSVDLEFGRLVAEGFERWQKARLVGKTRSEALVEVVAWAMNATWNDDGTQWGGRYETMWKCNGDNNKTYRNSKGNHAKCPFSHAKVWFPGDAPDICVECRSSVQVERRYLPDHSVKNRQTLIRTLIWYGLEQPDDINDGYRPYVFPDGTPAVELSGRLPLPWTSPYGEQYLLTWNFDYIGQFGDELFITDNKTTKKPLNDEFFQTYSPDTQFDTYSMIGTLAFPDLNIRGTMVDAAQVQVGGVTFGKHPYYKDEEQHEEHLHDLEVWIKQAEQYALKGYWPMNKRSCWLCPFKRVCSQSPSMRPGYLASNFQKRERWDPLRQR